MRKLSLERIDEAIELNRMMANHTIRVSAGQKDGRTRRFRTRSKGEIEALNQIAISKWNKAVSEGKIKSLGNRVIYYDYN